MSRIIFSFFLIIVSNYIFGQVYPTISITSDKSVITLGETINFTANFSGGGTAPKLEWKKNGNIVGTNAINYSDNTLKDGDKIACVLTSNDPQRVMNVVVSNFLSPKINPIQINPTLTGKALVGEPIVLNSNQTQQIIWKRNGTEIKNPIKDLIKNGITIAGSPENTNRIYWPNGIFIDENDDIYIADTYNNRILKQNFKTGSIELVAGGNGASSLGTPGQSNQVIEPLDVVKDKNGNLIIAAGNRIQIWEPGSVNGKTLLSKQAEHIFLDKKNNLYLSNITLDQIEKYNLSTLEGQIVAGGNGKGSDNNQLNRPSGIFVDEDENIYIVDNGNYRIQKWAKNAKSGKTIFGGNGSGKSDNQLYYPTDIYVDKVKGIYVTDSYRTVKCDTTNKTGKIILGTDFYGTSNNSLWHVKGISINSNGELFVADAYNNRLQKKNLTSGIISTQIGNDIQKNEIYRPEGIAVDSEKSIYVSDNNNRVHKILNNQFSGQTIFPNSNTGIVAYNYLQQPKSLQIDSLNNLYIADAGNYRIVKLNQINNSISVAAGGNGRGNSRNQFNYPQFIALSKSGNLFITDNNNDSSRIVKWNANSLQGTKIIDGKILETNYFNPSALYLDENDNLYFGANNAIYKLPYNSALPILVAGTKSYGNGNNNINYPTGIVVDDEENIFYLDNNQVKKWAKNAKYAVTIIGDINGGGNRSDQLSNPRGLVFDKDGNIYVSDTYNHRIQKFIIENNSTFIPTQAGDYSATIMTQFGEFTTPIFKVLAADADKDGIEDALDKCPNTPAGEQVDSNGCSLSQKDTDNDGINDKIDKCSGTKANFKVDATGCADYQKDSDNDGVTDDIDKCQGTPSGIKVDTFGCSEAQKDTCSNVKPILILKNGTELTTPLLGVGYVWYLNEVKIPNAINSSYSATTPGRYSVQVSKSSTCITAQSDNIFVIITEINHQDDQFIVFPNPLTKDIQMEFPPAFGAAVKVSLSDIKGSIVYSREGIINKELLNLSYLSSGTYFLTVYSNTSSEKRIFKIVKE